MRNSYILDNSKIDIILSNMDYSEEEKRILFTQSRKNTRFMKMLGVLWVVGILLNVLIDWVGLIFDLNIVSTICHFIYFGLAFLPIIMLISLLSFAITNKFPERMERFFSIPNENDLNCYFQKITQINEYWNLIIDKKDILDSVKITYLDNKEKQCNLLKVLLTFDNTTYPYNYYIIDGYIPLEEIEGKNIQLVVFRDKENSDYFNTMPHIKLCLI